MDTLQFGGSDDVQACLDKHDWSDFPAGPPACWPAQVGSIIRMVMNSSSPVVFWWGEELRCFYNDAYSKLIGIKHPHAFAQPLWQCWPELKDAFDGILARALGGEVCSHINLPFPRNLDGKTEQAWYSFSLIPMRDDLGKVIGVLNPAIDTTPQMINERRLAFQLELADRLRPLTEPHDVVAAASQALGEHLGLAGVHFSEVDDANGTFLFRREWTASERPSVAGKTQRLEDYGIEMIDDFRMGKAVANDDVARDPRTAQYLDFYNELNIASFLCIPLLKSGKVRVILALQRSEPHVWTDTEKLLAADTAERTFAAVESVEAQTRLREEQGRTQYILDSMTEGFALLDRDWKFLQFNSKGAEIVRRPREELLGQTVWEAMPDILGTGIEAVLRRVRTSRVAETYEHPDILPDGQHGWIEIRLYPSLDDGLAVFFRDITARKQTEEEMREAGRRKDEFLAMLAHELRNPLAPISSAASLIGLGQMDPSRLKATSEVIRRQVNHMTSLVDDLLDVSRVTRGLVQITKTPQDLKSVIASAIEQVRPIMETQRHHLGVELPPEAAYVLGDQKRLIQILTNLLNNAAKYTPPGGSIRLRLKVEDERVLIQVDDNGIGIAPELQPRVFDLFSQAERTADRSQGGLGLGLALVKSLTELHDGQVTCMSEGLGRGSCFSVTLPGFKLHRSGHDRRAVSRVEPLPREPLRILIVDDNMDAASMLAMLLEAGGHEVMVEHDSGSALTRALAALPQVGLLDIGLPRIDGNELARQLRGHPQLQDMTLIAVTGYGQEHDRQAALAAGFDHHLTKPVTAEQLNAVLCSIDKRQEA
jgi:PAS domain S-box-containing protein